MSRIQIYILSIVLWGCQGDIKISSREHGSDLDSACVDSIILAGNGRKLDWPSLENDSLKIAAVDELALRLKGDTTLRERRISDYQFIHPTGGPPVNSLEELTLGADDSGVLVGYYQGEELVKIFHSAVKPSINNGVIDVWTTFYFSDLALIAVEERCFINEPPMGRPTCVSHSCRLQYFENEKVFSKQKGSLIGELPDRHGPYGADESEFCWCLSTHNEDVLVLELLTSCLTRLAN